MEINSHAQVVADEQLRRVAFLGDTGHSRDQLDSRYRPRLSLRTLPLSGGFAALCTARSYAQLVRQRGVAALARGLRSRL